MSLSCRVTSSIPEGMPGARLSTRHRAACLRCQADDVRRRALLRELAALRDEVLAAPASVHARVMSRLGSQGEPSGPSRALRRVVGGSAAAAAVGAAALLGGLARRRARAAG